MLLAHATDSQPASVDSLPATDHQRGPPATLTPAESLRKYDPPLPVSARRGRLPAAKPSRAARQSSKSSCSGLDSVGEPDGSASASTGTCVSSALWMWGLCETEGTGGGVASFFPAGRSHGRVGHQQIPVATA